MSETVIRSQRLGKKFTITHQLPREGELFVDVLMERLRWLTRLGRERTAERRQRHEEFWALRDVNFEIKAGELVSIIGHNGAGKTTLLKVLSRITEPTEGRVDIFGRVNSLLEVGTGFHPELTGRENIYLNGAILGMTRAEMRRKFDDIVAFAGVEKFIDTPVKRYSTGMYVRLAFSVAAYLEAEILIVDEVLAVGDAEFQARCLNRMSEVASSGRTVLFVSHNLAAVTALTERTLVLNGGHVVFDGPVNEALTYYAAALGKVEHNHKWDRGLNSSLLAASLLDEEGRPTDRYVPGAKLRLRIELETTGLPGLSLDAVLRDRQNIAIAYFASNNFSQVLLPAHAGRYECILSLGSYLLAAGEYGFDLMISVPNIMVDHEVASAVRFSVDTCSPNGIPFNFSQELGLGNQAMLLSDPLRFTPLPSATS